MPVYNAEVFLAEAIDSILKQTFADFEFLIIDDGSTDNSRAIVQAYVDPRIRYVLNEKNLGISATLNKGIEMANCELIARMDADDISLPGRLEKQYNYLQAHPDCVFVSSWFRRFNADGTEDRVLKNKPEHFYYHLIFNNWINHPSVMYKRSAVIDVGMYSKFYAEDFNLWSKLVRKYKFHNIPEVLVHYRIGEKSLSRGVRKMEYIQAHLEQIIENIHYYTGDKFPLNIAEAEFLRGTGPSVSMNEKRSLIVSENLII
jgi:glycosyltransferase involved in cell wall biosynthesis